VPSRLSCRKQAVASAISLKVNFGFELVENLAQSRMGTVLQLKQSFRADSRRGHRMQPRRLGRHYFAKDIGRGLLKRPEPCVKTIGTAFELLPNDCRQTLCICRFGIGRTFGRCCFLPVPLGFSGPPWAAALVPPQTRRPKRSRG
jgi:hypothetical protein